MSELSGISGFYVHRVPGWVMMSMQRIPLVGISPPINFCMQVFCKVSIIIVLSQPKIGICKQILEFLNIKCYESPFSDPEVVTCRQADIMKLICTFFQLIVVKCAKTRLTFMFNVYI
jgi:hypothetical protein